MKLFIANFLLLMSFSSVAIAADQLQNQTPPRQAVVDECMIEPWFCKL